MADSVTLAAVAGHLWIVGGRAVRVPPPGALIERAPRRAPRVREEDLFAILVTPTEGAHAPARALEILAQLAADVYFGSGGGITNGLREALGAVNTVLQAGAGHLTVGAVALVLRGAELYVARCGDMFAALQQWPALESVPADRQDPLALALEPLGTSATPDIQFGHFTVAPGQAIVLADASLSGHSADALRTALAAGNVAAIAERLKQLAGAQTAASVIRFLEADEEDPSGIVPQPGARAPRPAPRLTSAERAPVPPPEPTLPPAPAPAPTVRSVPSAPEPVAPAPAAPIPVAPLSAVAPEAPPSPGSAGEAAPFPAADEVGEPVEPAPPVRKVRLSELAGRLRPPERAQRGPGALQRAMGRVERVGRIAMVKVLSALLALLTLIGAALSRLVPEPRENERSGLPTTVAIGLVVLIPLLIVIIVVGLALSEEGRGQFQTYLDRAKSAHKEALELSGGTCENLALRPLWVEVLRLAEQAGSFRPNDPDVLVIDADARNYLDCFDRVERRDLKLLHEFPKDAELVGPIVNGGVDVYTLDRKNGRIYHDTLNETGDGLTMRSNDPILWNGQTISGATGNFRVGELIDIEWLASGGTAQDNVLIALDRSGLLLAYSATFFESAQMLIHEDWWVNPVALAVFRANIYILDPGANQIWRYVPPAGVRAYPNAPEEYFNGPERPDLTGAIDLGISDEGAVYVLFEDGTLRRYRRNVQSYVEEQPFDLRDNPPGTPAAGAALFVDNDPLSRHLYIVDPVTEAVYELRWGGTFRRGYRPRNLPEAFAGVSGFFADSVARNNMYVLAGNRLYQFKRTP